MYQNDLPMSLKSDTFNALCADFDDVLRSTLRGMVETEQDTAEISVKVKISLTEGSAPDFSVAGGQQTREITKPKFDHTVSAVIQRKEKKTGTLSGEYELVFDSDTGKYVMRPIDNGQMNLFNRDGEIIEVDYNEVPTLPEGQRMLLGDSQSEDSEEEGVYTEEEEGRELENARDSGEVSEDISTPFGWLKQFVGEEMRVTEAMGNFTVRTIENKVVLSSATSESSPFYCSAEKLEPHVGHQVVCVGYGDGEIANVSIECEDCNEVLFDLDAPNDAENDEEEMTDEEIANALDEASNVLEEMDEENEDEGYGYDSPETDDEAE